VSLKSLGFLIGIKDNTNLIKTNSKPSKIKFDVDLGSARNSIFSTKINSTDEFDIERIQDSIKSLKNSQSNFFSSLNNSKEKIQKNDIFRKDSKIIKEIDYFS
jgi:hypothetical protein